MKPVLFVSDLHLSLERPEINRVFFDFLEQRASGAGALYILGDLFDHWAGDDDLAEPLHASVTAALRRLTDRAVPVFVMRGNRDFLLGHDFEQSCGATLLDDAVRVDLFGTPTLLLHGDTLCTDDAKYQAYRAQVRKPWAQKLFLTLPLAIRKKFVGGLRKRSEHEVASKQPEIMDVNRDAVAEVLRENGYPRLIHGHTHRPARHIHHVDGRDCERHVLAAWYEGGQYLAVTPDGAEDVPLPR
jgi:UDP-2,3-diacylglucosamine hydrolase